MDHPVPFGCSALADRVAPYLDGELSRSEQTLFEAHLESCSDCQELVERVAAVDLSPPPPLPETSDPTFWRDMEARLSAEMQKISAAPATPPGVTQRLSRWELRVSLPVILGYAALLLLCVGWSLANLQRALEAEQAATTLTDQLAREQRQQAPPQAVPMGSTMTASAPIGRTQF